MRGRGSCAGVVGRRSRRSGVVLECCRDLCETQGLSRHQGTCQHPRNSRIKRIAPEDRHPHTSLLQARCFRWFHVSWVVVSLSCHQPSFREPRATSPMPCENSTLPTRPACCCGQGHPLSRLVALGAFYFRLWSGELPRYSFDGAVATYGCYSRLAYSRTTSVSTARCRFSTFFAFDCSLSRVVDAIPAKQENRKPLMG